MQDLNRVQPIGHLGHDPEVQYTEQGTAQTTSASPPALVSRSGRARRLPLAEPLAYAQGSRVDRPRPRRIQGDRARAQPAPHAAQVPPDEPEPLEEPDRQQDTPRL